MIDYRCRLEEGKFYHIYNRGINSENLFYTNENYRFFLKRYYEYLFDYVDTYVFCLLPNHFHLLVGVKERNINVSHLKNAKHLGNTSDAFQRLFTSYAKAINKQENRHGSLLEKPFKRIEITSTLYLANLVFYIHANPQLHGIVNDFRMYPWSSYNRIIKNEPTVLQKETVLEWFDSPDNFAAYHKQKVDFAILKELGID